MRASAPTSVAFTGQDWTDPDGGRSDVPWPEARHGFVPQPTI